MHFIRACACLCLCFATIVSPAATTTALTLCCAPEHELYRLLLDNNVACNRSDSFAEGVKAAPSESGVLLLADNYPAARARVEPLALDEARTKKLRLYLEYPDAIPGVAFDGITTTSWERVVVTTSTFGTGLQPMSIVSVSGCHYLPTTSAQTMLSIARVAGYDKAIYGLPESAKPILFELPGQDALVATTALSTFISGRYGPNRSWKHMWESLLTRLSGTTVNTLEWTPAVRPAFGPKETLPEDYEARARVAAADWLLKSNLLISPDRQPLIHKTLRAGGEDLPAPSTNAPAGDGSLGILEGYSSAIQFDGSQRQRVPIRADCQAESAMLLAVNASLRDDPQHSAIARNLLSFTYGASGFCDGVRGDPKHGAYGLIAWGAVAPSWEVGNYGDDNARVILATLASAALLKSKDWDVPVLRAIAANFRTTGRKGFRGDRVDNPELAKHGWKHIAERDTINLSPHFEAWLWACYLVAYQQTGYEPFLTRTREAIRTIMEAYPAGWRWQDNSERTDMLFVLAWLLRVDDTPQHREWLHQMANDLLKHVHESGAIPEILAGSGGGHYQVPQSNEAYGTGESPILQKNGDPVSDQLYTTAFGLIALHEAVAVTSDTALQKAEDRLATYLCRIQVKSESQPYLDGAWLRAFDFNFWDYWASSGDIGWGPWCAEAGWGHTWIGTTLGLRAQNESLWDLITSRELKAQWPSVEKEMLREMPVQTSR